MKNNPGSNRIRQVEIPDEKFLLTEENSEVEDYVSIKARSVVRGDQDKTEDDIPSDSPTVDRNTMKLLIAIAAIMGWSLRSVDISAAFSQGKDVVGLQTNLQPKTSLKLADPLTKAKAALTALRKALQSGFQKKGLRREGESSRYQ